MSEQNIQDTTSVLSGSAQDGSSASEVRPSHTPGPWTMQTVRTSVGVCFKVGPFPWKRDKLNHACIYADYPSPDSPEYAENLANAKLIAAAPELLEALKPFAMFACSPTGECHCHNCNARDVIANLTHPA